MAASLRHPRGLLAGLVGLLAGIGALGWLADVSTATPPVPPSTLSAATPAQFGGGGAGFGGIGEAPEPPARIYVASPITAKAAAVWSRLEQPVELPFASETPLGDVLKFLAQATRGEGGEPGLSFYADPKGLVEAERTIESPVTIELNAVPARTALKLVLDQLDLRYWVHDDGFIVIDYTERDTGSVSEVSARILDELAALRREVAELRAGRSAGSGGGGGGIGGAGAAGGAGGGFR